MFTKILTAAVTVILIFAAIVSTRPAEFQIDRSISIEASPALVFPHVSDLHNWKAWSPWAKLDPNSKETHSGSPSGVGAIMHWSGNNDVGEGSMTISESQMNELIRIQLDIVKPFKASNKVEFTFKPEGSKTLVTWTMSGKNNFIGKAMSLLMNCDKMVGGQFEQGLSQLKSIVEK